MSDITITRGDSAKLMFYRRSASGEIIGMEPDSLYFTVKRNYSVEEFEFQKTLADMTRSADGAYHFVIDPSDTDDLRYGDYVYDIQVKQSGLKTTIAKGAFIIDTEATFASNETED